MVEAASQGPCDLGSNPHPLSTCPQNARVNLSHGRQWELAPGSATPGDGL